MSLTKPLTNADVESKQPVNTANTIENAPEDTENTGKGKKWNRAALVAAVAAGGITVEAANLILDALNSGEAEITEEEVADYDGPTPVHTTHTGTETTMEQTEVEVDPDEVMILDETEGIDDTVVEVVDEPLVAQTEDVYTPINNAEEIDDVMVEVVPESDLVAQYSEDVMVNDVDVICETPEGLDDVDVTAADSGYTDDYLADAHNADSIDDIQMDLIV